MTPSTLPRRRTRRLARVVGEIIRARLRPWHGDAGMSTVEYAIGCVAAAAFAAVLYGIVSGESVVTALTELVQRALSTEF